MDDERPLPEYATLAGAFWLVFAAFMAKNRKKLPERVAFGDVARIALSSYKLSRVIAKEEITAFVRAPVTEDPAAQKPKPDGMRRVLGELLTCPYCTGLWISSLLSYSHILFPKESRFATSIFSAYAITDFLNAGFTRLRGQS